MTTSYIMTVMMMRMKLRCAIGSCRALAAICWSRGRAAICHHTLLLSPNAFPSPSRAPVSPSCVTSCDGRALTQLSGLATIISLGQLTRQTPSWHLQLHAFVGRLLQPLLLAEQLQRQQHLSVKPSDNRQINHSLQRTAGTWCSGDTSASRERHQTGW